MTKVLHVIDHLELGGAQSAMLDLIRCADRERLSIEVAVMHGRGPFADALEREGVTVHSLAPAKWPPIYVGNFLRLARENPYDVLHFHLNGANWVAKVSAAMAAVPGVRVAHDHTSGDLRFRGWHTLLPEALAHQFSDCVIAVSEEVREFLLHYESLSPDLVETVPNGVDTDLFRPCNAEEKLAARRLLGLPEKAWIAGGLGRLAYEKNFSLFVKVAARLPEVFFVIGGTGPEEEMLKGEIAKLGVSERVRLLGQVDERVAFHRALDVFVLTSLFEGLPMTILEAMSSGVPVVASRLPGIARVIRSGENGMLAEPGSEEEFVKGIAEVKGGARVAAAGRRTAEEKYGAKLTARRVEAIYERLLN